MKRIKKHNIKHEKPETSTSHARERDVQEHDLAYYIHDRVELMHQVFSVLRSKDLRAMAPECVRRLSIDNLQELCTEELLGISSKRLCAILDGAEPPSDTESSSQSPEHMETISLDSISSDEEILSQTSSSKKKKHKHRRRESNPRAKKRKSQEPPAAEAERSRASRAGLTVLELLELQARARAIRAQLQQEHANKVQTTVAESPRQATASDNEVEIKEEAPEVVEISSEDEKPDLGQLHKADTELPALKEPDKNGKDSSPSKSTETNKASNKSKEKKKKKEKEKRKKDKKKETDRNKEELSNETSKSKKDLPNMETDLIENKDTSADKELVSSKENSQMITKRISDLIITVPQQHARKIKLNRNKVTISVSNEETNVASTENPIHSASVSRSPEKTVKSIVSIRTPENAVKSSVQVAEKPAKSAKEKSKEKSKKKQKKKEVRRSIDKDGSDHDEITLQLSDSEKMDLLEDFDRKHYDNVSSSSSDSDSSSETDSDVSNDSSEETEKDFEQISLKVTILPENDNILTENDNTDDQKVTVETDAINMKFIEQNVQETTKVVNPMFRNSNVDENSHEAPESSERTETTDNSIHVINRRVSRDVEEGYILTESSNSAEKVIIISNIDDIPIKEDSKLEALNQNTDVNEMLAVSTSKTIDVEGKSIESSLNIRVAEEKSLENTTETTYLEERTGGTHETVNPKISAESNSTTIDLQEISVENYESQSIFIEEKAEQTETVNNEKESDLSDGEISERESSEVEAFDLKPEVVCISDEERDKISKKKKKKDKKSKKEKKSKKSKSDFREGADENFYEDAETVEIPSVYRKSETIDHADAISLDEDDDVYEILELSDDSSCYEVEGTVLSKEPTADEIAALSAKIDEIEREEVVTHEQIREHERKEPEKDTNLGENEENLVNLENISWKDRYLDSTKVKKVLTTSNILNALRKKNKELKKKLEESKTEEVEKEVEEEIVPVESKELEEGTIDHYKTLQGSTKYVNPVPDPTIQLADTTENKTTDENTDIPNTQSEEKSLEIKVTGEMKKDAKQLLKMYKKLLKYNDITKTKQKDPNKKKKKKKKRENTGGSIVSG